MGAGAPEKWLKLKVGGGVLCNGLSPLSPTSVPRLEKISHSSDLKNFANNLHITLSCIYSVPTAVIQGIDQSHKLGLVVSSTTSATSIQVTFV